MLWTTLFWFVTENPSETLKIVNVTWPDGSYFTKLLGSKCGFKSVISGQYTCKEGKNSPCLVYVSFNQKIYIYWKVELERMESSNLQRVLEEKPEFKSQLEALGVGEYKNNSKVVSRKHIQLQPEHRSLNSANIASVGVFIWTGDKLWLFAANKRSVLSWHSDSDLNGNEDGGE